MVTKRELGRGERVLPGLWRLRLPLPWPGVPHCNAWAIAAGPGIVLVDTGMHQPDSIAQLERALAQVNLRLEQVQLVVCTHAHSDHWGQAAPICERAGCELWMHPNHEHATRSAEDPEAARARRLEVGRQSGVPEVALRRYAERLKDMPSGIARLIEPVGAVSRQRTILCEALAPSGRAIQLAFTGRMIPGPGGKDVQGYVAEFTPDETGNWKTTAHVEIDGNRIESSPNFFTVRAVSAETLDKPANQAILKALAQNSGGRYGTAEDLNDFLKSLTIKERQERRLEYVSLWQSFWVLSLLIGLLSLEWILRKMGSMV